jgi:hypothetical protein
VLVTDATESAVRSGETDAKLLLKLASRGVELFSCPGLHAKVLLLDDVAVIGSGNMSEAARSTLVEAAIMTDATTVVSGIASLIEQLKRQSKPLDDKALNALAKIKVVRRGFGQGGKTGGRKRPKVSELGTRTWLAGVFEQDRELTAEEEGLIEDSSKRLARATGMSVDDIDWIRWTGTGPFVDKGSNGDSLIQIYSPDRKKPPTQVFKAVPVLLKTRLNNCSFVFVGRPGWKKTSVRYSAFKRLVKRLGGPARFGGNSERLLAADLADAISRAWNKA